MLIGGVAPLDAFNYVGTCAAFGFMVAYALVTLAAPVYLKRIGQLTGKDVAGCVAAELLLLIPAVGSVYPIPDPPVNYFPYLFLVYLAAGIAWILAFYHRKPAAMAVVQADLERLHSHFENAPAITMPTA
jgi:amino acid transporter